MLRGDRLMLKSHFFRFGVILLAGLAGLTFYMFSASTNNPAPQSNANAEQSIQGEAPHESSQPERFPQRSTPPTSALDDASAPSPVIRLDPALAATIKDFQEQVLNNAPVQRIRVETNFTPTPADGSAQEGDPNKALAGYVAFMTKPEAGHPEGAKKTMEAIAQEYFLHFPDAPSVRVSMVIGGRVAAGRTFRQDSQE
jgi:hypothetical protein